VWVSTDEHKAYYGLPLIPWVLSLLFILPRLLRAYSLLRAVVDPQVEVIETVISLSMRTTRVQTEVRDDINAKVCAMQLKQPGLTKEEGMKMLFEEIDVNSDGKVSAEELRQQLRAMGIFTHAITFDNLFRILDPDRSEGIELDEFMRFLGPAEYQPQSRSQDDAALILPQV
jgi:hypothetical protein